MSIARLSQSCASARATFAFGCLPQKLTSTFRGMTRMPQSSMFPNGNKEIVRCQGRRARIRHCARSQPVADSPALGEVCDLVTSGSRGWAEFYSTSGPGFIRAQNIRFGRLRLDELAYVN